jgi:hypothetical protein
MSLLRNRFLAVSGLLAGLWFLLSPSQVFADPFPTDTKPHFCKNNPAEHIDYSPPTPPAGYEQIPPGGNYTWTICRRNSSASEWYLVIMKGGAEVCRKPQDNPGTPQIETIPALTTDTLTCNTATIGVYTATVYWKVGSSQFMNHTDYFYKPQ